MWLGSLYLPVDYGRLTMCKLLTGVTGELAGGLWLHLVLRN